MAVEAYALTSVANVKSYLGISVTTYDTLFELLIDSCTDWIERECGGRRFFDAGTDVTEYHDGDFDLTGRNKVFLKQYPVNGVTSVKYRTGNISNPTWTAFSDDDYETNTYTGVLYFGRNTISTFQALPQGRQNIEVKYQGGWTSGNIPHDLEHACIKLVAKEFDKRKSQGVTAEAIGSARIDWNEDISPDVRRIITKYRRFFR